MSWRTLLTLKGGLMLVLATGTIGWICGCTQSASLPATSSVSRAHSTMNGSQPSAENLVSVPQQVTIPQAPFSPSFDGSASSHNVLQVAYRNKNQTPWSTKVKPRAWKYIVLHHSAADHGSVESIHEAHLQRRDSNGNPWLGIGYHFVIGNGKGMKDGAVETTFRWRQQLHGAHAGNATYNNSGIGICLVGNFEDYPPTSRQFEAVRRLVGQLKTKYKIQPTNIVGHGDVKKTACPGRYFSVAKVTQGSPVLQFGDFRSPKSTGVTLVAQEQYAQ